MRNVPLFLMSLCWMLFTPSTVEGCPVAEDWLSASFDEMDQWSLAECDALHLAEVAGMADLMMSDTALDRQIRGEVGLSLLADELQRRSKAEDFEVEAPAVVHLVQILERHQFHLALSRPSDWEKLIHYLQEGRYAYVAKRAVDRGYAPYLLVTLMMSGVGLAYALRRRKLRREGRPAMVDTGNG